MANFSLFNYLKASEKEQSKFCQLSLYLLSITDQIKPFISATSNEILSSDFAGKQYGLSVSVLEVTYSFVLLFV